MRRRLRGGGGCFGGGSLRLRSLTLGRGGGGGGPRGSLRRGLGGAPRVLRGALAHDAGDLPALLLDNLSLHIRRERADEGRVDGLELTRGGGAGVGARVSSVEPGDLPIGGEEFLAEVRWKGVEELGVDGLVLGLGLLFILVVLLLLGRFLGDGVLSDLVGDSLRGGRLIRHGRNRRLRHGRRGGLRGTFRLGFSRHLHVTLRGGLLGLRRRLRGGLRSENTREVRLQVARRGVQARVDVSGRDAAAARIGPGRRSRVTDPRRVPAPAAVVAASRAATRPDRSTRSSDPRSSPRAGRRACRSVRRRR